MAKTPEKTATLEQSHWEDGVWHVRVSVKANGNTYASTHAIEGAEDMTVENLTAAILALY
jgi:hypothetical protein